ncbi:UbiD family decarboxylase [Saccharopolyspora antimicrobica]|uniref:UbiD family decarboxylase n=1 Tax=Saccharopolyspora antimicrobica TaxID=455193 RepID=A0A1I4S0Q7_9PSEU|nr:UbiD family decarboxylase [Saccharopolyspora antimicrobica]RKT87536.1 UbiD family decarboxylase [Saccharopolyspora antimicrobica]SFM58112.1 UbiD family decarboxylase [Saccharopolyspora antimicrobica]
MTPSPRQDAHVFFAEYRHAHPEDVVVVDEPVSAVEGVTGLIYELTARGRDEMLVCNEVDGVAAPVVTNVFASRRRIARFFDAEPGQLHEVYQSRASRLITPRVVDSSPLVEDAEVDLATVPMFQHFASDRAPYMTSGIVVAEDPDTKVGNMSYHRSMVHSPAELATSLHSRGDLWRLLAKYAERDEPMPVAVVIGGHPLFMLAASARVPADVDERAVAGGLFGEPLDVVRTPRHGIGVPAWAEYVLEGTINPRRHAEEGPFGEFSGYSSHRSTNNVLRVETVLRREDALLVDVAGGNTADHLNLARVPRESELAEKLKDRFPDVTAVHYPTSGTHFHCYVALRESRPGQARQVLLGLLGWDPYVKTAVAVDADVDITSDAEVLWALATHFQPHRDLFVVDGLPGSPLDPSSDPGGTTSRMGLDATRGPDFAGDRIVVSATARNDARRLLGTDGGRR